MLYGFPYLQPQAGCNISFKTCSKDSAKNDNADVRFQKYASSAYIKCVIYNLLHR